MQYPSELTINYLTYLYNRTINIVVITTIICIPTTTCLLWLTLLPLARSLVAVGTTRHPDSPSEQTVSPGGLYIAAGGLCGLRRYPGIDLRCVPQVLPFVPHHQPRHCELGLREVRTMLSLRRLV